MNNEFEPYDKYQNFGGNFDFTLRGVNTKILHDKNLMTHHGISGFKKCD